MSKSLSEKIAKELVEKHRGEFISRRDGYVIIKVIEDGKITIVWIRQNPVTRKALELFKKIISKYEHDRLVLLKLYKRADQIRPEELEIFDEVKYAV